jgi:hypothetical protein
MTDLTAPIDTTETEYFTLGEAVKQVKASRTTIQRALKADKIEGAYMNDDGIWRIPFSGLVAAGLAPRFILSSGTTPETAGTTALEPLTPPMDLATEVIVLRAEIEHLKVLISERAATVELLRDVVDKLTAALKERPAELAQVATEPRRRWWGGTAK